MRQFLIFCIFLSFGSSLFAQTVNQIGYTKRGKSSYFADDRGGIFTASGERYDMNRLVAAHPYIAFNSYVRVTNLDNGKSVIVRINDRMEAADRIIDLSKAAAEQIGTVGKLVVDVKIEIVPDPAQLTTAIPPTNDYTPHTPPPYTPPTNNYPPQKEVLDPNMPIYHTVQKGESMSLISSTYQINIDDILKLNGMKKSDVLAIGRILLIKPAVITALPETKPEIPVAKKELPANFEERFAKLGTYTLDGTPVKPLGYGAQIGWYSDINESVKLGRVFDGMQFGNVYIQSGWESGKKAYRVIIGSYPKKEETKALLEFLNERQYHAFPRAHYGMED